MVPAEYEYQHLREMSAALYSGEEFKENHPRAVGEFRQVILDLNGYLRGVPKPKGGPAVELDGNDVFWYPHQLGKRFIRVTVDPEEELAEMDRYPGPDNFGEPIIGIMISGRDYPMAAIIRNRAFPVSSFTGSARTKEELAIVKSALFIPVNLKKWIQAESRSAVLNSSPASMLR